MGQLSRFGRRALGIAAIALAVKLAFALLLPVWIDVRDADYNNHIARQMAESIRGESDFSLDRDATLISQTWSYAHIFLLAGIYALFGYVPFLGQVIFILFIIGAGLLLALAARDWFGERTALISLVLLYALPAINFWTSYAVKESLVLFLVALALFSLDRLLRGLPLFGAVYLASLFLLWYARYYLVLLLAIVSVSALALRYLPSLGIKQRHVFVALAALACVALAIKLPGILSTLDWQRNVMDFGRTAFSPNADISTPFRALAYAPVGLAHLFFAPFPWHVDGLKDLVWFMLDNIPWLLLLPGVVLGVRAAMRKRHWRSWPLLAYLLLLATLYTFLEGNVGTLVRHRIQLTAFLLPFAAAGFLGMVDAGRARAGPLRVFFLVPYTIEGPSNRLRVHQYLPFLAAHGIEYRVRSFTTHTFYRLLYKSGNVLQKCVYFAGCAVNRLLDIVRALRFDVIFIHRECFPIGPPIIEWILARFGKPLIYDFDDAIFLRGQHNSALINLLKNPGKVRSIIRMSTAVIAGNAYLAEFARRYNPHVTIIPTPVDTGTFRLQPARPQARPVIGWIGSHSTARYLESLTPAFQKLATRHEFEFRIIGAGKGINMPGVPVVNKPWSLRTELEDVSAFDIGVYPLPDDAWARGKCGFKALEYMALGVPVVASPVGMNADLVQDGVNGFHARTTEEWVSRLSALLQDAALRRKMGGTGRQQVVSHYSVEANAPKLLRVLREAIP
jgi:glycosyltransferase involved in cell wall biosynthesis